MTLPLLALRDATFGNLPLIESIQVTGKKNEIILHVTNVNKIQDIHIDLLNSVFEIRDTQYQAILFFKGNNYYVLTPDSEVYATVNEANKAYMLNFGLLEVASHWTVTHHHAQNVPVGLVQDRGTRVSHLAYNILIDATWEDNRADQEDNVRCPPRTTKGVTPQLFASQLVWAQRGRCLDRGGAH